MTAVRVPRVTAALFAAVVLTASPALSPLPAQTPRTSDTSFAALVARVSEPNGYFDSDNIVTNELSYLSIASQLTKVGTHGGVYIGVGPDQNFSYIALIQPKIAFLVDIRRDNMLEHLLFKSLFDLSRNRLEYLCLLLGKLVPADVDTWGNRPTSDILAYLTNARTDSSTVQVTRRASNQRIASYRVPLDARDRATIDRYRSQFVNEGLDTRYSSLGRNNRWSYPPLSRLIIATDREGHERGYLADERAFQYVRNLQLSNRIIPVVGNVAGNKALKAIATYAAERKLVVSAFYLSNVEQYLMTRDGGFDAYARNVVQLPHDRTSVIIRSYFGRFSGQHPLFISYPGNRSTSMIEPIDSFVRAFKAGELATYADLVLKRYVSP